MSTLPLQSFSVQLGAHEGWVGVCLRCPMSPAQGHPMARCSCHVPARRTWPPEPHCVFGSPSPSLVLWRCCCLHRANPGHVCLVRLPLPPDAKQGTCGWWPEGSTARCPLPIPCSQSGVPEALS